MDINIRKRREAGIIEAAINQNLFIICTIVTVVTMILLLTNFFTRGAFFPTSIGFFYLVVVLIYSLHKEFIRWLGEKKSRRQGEYFVYAWVILTTILYAISFFTNNYFGLSKEGYPLGTLADVSYTTIEVLGVFVITRIMKIVFMVKR